MQMDHPPPAPLRTGCRAGGDVLLRHLFGPHGIPVTVFPKREYKDKPDAMQLQSNTFQEGIEVKREVNGAVPDDLSPVPPPERLWTSKPPPLFHEGAPYPPPLFIRDTYNQSIPQPPPRKIKRPKRKMYREEPTSIMNAIKLRPRQVLCDKCKNSVVAEKKEIRKGSSDSSRYEDKKRRNDSVATVNKKLKTDHKVDGKNQNESQRRNAVVRVSNIAHSRGRVVKVSAQANTSKAQLSTKKVLQSKNMDHAKAREVLKIAKEKAQKKQSETSASKNTHSKVHFTRRYQNPSSGSLPPRVRLKPQRYRNEENDSSLKTGLEKIRSGKLAPKPQSRCTSTRSAGEALSENQSPSEGPEEAASEVQDTSEVYVPGEQEELQTMGKKGSKSNISVYLTLNQEKSDSCSASVCSIDSMDDVKSSNSECSSSESFVFPPGKNFQLRFNKKRKGLYRRAITEAAKAAKQLTPEVRALLTQFETEKIDLDKSPRSQQMAAITSDSDESCCSLTVSDRPLWIQTGSIEVNSEAGRGPNRSEDHVKNLIHVPVVNWKQRCRLGYHSHRKPKNKFLVEPKMDSVPKPCPSTSPKRKRYSLGS
ncbi:hypothetical protein A6R68_18858 [Neotoma lepida]|uniref:PWWP domain-containing protein n=1 Tax=Neotoma lepida TaxID=56216 RepID=A0A1A6HM24_NEOLE|nr:hypothetical protein A6R68_18858 [Neotoma lepida]